MNPETTRSAQPLNAAWSYRPGKAFHDEVLTSDRRLRDHWRPLADSLLSMGPAGLEKRWQEGRRVIHENGVTYNVYGDPRSTDRPWPLDPIPLVMDPAEWSAIEAAIVQRATLLNSIAADLYGPQRLLRDRLLPADLVFPNPAFLRPCHGVHVPGGVYLHIYSADLARSPDGQWWVIADRTQAPSGAGYALENRLVSARVLPDVFRAAQVQRLAGFFQTLRESLLGMVTSRRENPRIVVLTPGPYNETYFEHAFLARYLGYTLVEGGDLAVRDNRVYLKTLGGLLPVDVILRRQDDAFCDPLELRSDSMLGVPGLMQVVRSGNVAVANALGSGLLESAAAAAFLPGLCRHLLSEELRMPTVATWWCGDEMPFQMVRENLARLVVKPVFPSSGAQPIFGSRLSRAEREELLLQMEARPGRYVAQEQVSLSTVPVWSEGKLQPRHAVLRVYAVASNGSYAVMPGGLTRVSASLDTLVVSLQRGGGSKDTWVLSDAPPAQATLLNTAAPALEISRATVDLPSRVADNLFWLGRYVERVDASLRIARAMLPRISQESHAAATQGVLAGARILAASGCLPGDAAVAAASGAKIEKELLAMVFDSGSRGGVVWNIHQVRRVAWLLRDSISADAWRILNRLDEQFSEPAPPEPLQVSGAQDLLNHAIITLSAFSGLVMENTTRGHGWRFLDIGRRVERATQMIEMLRYGLAHPRGAEGDVLHVILEIGDSSLTYRSRYLSSMQPDLVLDLLLVDEANPRSVAFQLVQLLDHIDQLPETRSLVRRPAEARLALSLLTAVQLAQVKELVQSEGPVAAAPLEAFLSKLAADLRGLSETLTRVYFNHAVPSRQLAAS